jgi:outer membrane phospholipase A
MVPYGMGDEASKRLPSRRGYWEAQIGAADLFRSIFDVNELIFRIYSGGSGRVNPFQGGQELTYREKRSARKLLLPLYFQVFHGYGENLLDADESRWGLRAGVGF